MMKLSRFLLSSRNQISEKLLAGRANDVRNTLKLHALISQAGMSSTSQEVSAKGSFGGRIFAPYNVFKAFSVDPVLPTFMKLDSGDLKVEHNWLTFASGGKFDWASSIFLLNLSLFWHINRGMEEIMADYVHQEMTRNWILICLRLFLLIVTTDVFLSLFFSGGATELPEEKRIAQHFALSPKEVGSLLTMGPGDSSQLVHDPAMESRNVGQMRKSLSIKAIADCSVISLNVTNNILKTGERFVVPVTNAEFTVMKTACSFALPHLVGCDRLTNQLPKSSTASSEFIKGGSKFSGFGMG